jgi:hypothetical protein
VLASMPGERKTQSAASDAAAAAADAMKTRRVVRLDVASLPVSLSNTLLPFLLILVQFRCDVG